MSKCSSSVEGPEDADADTISLVSTHLTDVSLDEDVPEHKTENDLRSWLEKSHQNVLNLKNLVLNKLTIKGHGPNCTTKVDGKRSKRSEQDLKKKATDTKARAIAENARLGGKPTALPDFFKKKSAKSDFIDLSLDNNDFLRSQKQIHLPPVMLQFQLIFLLTTIRNILFLIIII